MNQRSSCTRYASLLALALAVGACASDTTPERTPTPARAGRVAIGPDADTTDVSSLVGKPAPEWDLPRWFNGPPHTVQDLRGDVVLVRWFMSSDCPYCSATAPNLVSLHETYAEKGLTIVGMYHHKAETPLVVEDVRKLVIDHYRFPFSVAIDEEWKTLKRYWLDAHPTSWTSVSFLIDRSGTVRFAHLGGEYAKGSADDAQMRAWIEELLIEKGAPGTASELGEAGQP